MRAIPVGAKGSYSLRVLPAHLANQFKDAMLPQVFATPMMVTAMENAALNAVRDYLDPGMRSPIEMEDNEVTKVDGRRIEFTVSARDEMEEIGNGTHERMVVDMGRIAQRLDAKKRP